MKTRHIAHNMSAPSRIACLLLLSCLLLPGIGQAAVKEHTIQIEFDFDCQAIPDKTVVAYHLFKEGEQVCNVAAADPHVLDCTMMSTTGKFAFTLRAVYNDGSTSPVSAPFYLTVVDETSPILGLLALTGQSPADIGGLGEIAGDSAIDLADVISLLRQNSSAL
jgi:hypothetical protein